jgi:hypothetical protein
MYRGYISLLCFCLLFSGCFLKKKEAETSSVQLPKLGVAFKLPENFQPLPKDKFGDMEALGATLVEVEPFTVTPLYAYAEQSGKGILVISELQFSEGSEPEKYPLDNIYMYKKNLEAHFNVEEIKHEEINGKDVTTVLLAMLFEDEEGGISLFKGLSYKYPDQFFMIDLYVANSKAASQDAFGFQNIFNSLSIY